MSSMVCGRSPFARTSVCPKAKRKTLIAIFAIYLSAAVIAFVAFNAARSARSTRSLAVQETVSAH
jgi:hypothetical protein